MSQFDDLLAQLKAAEDEQSTLAKALPAEDGEDDEAIQAAAADGDTDADADDEDPDDHDEPDEDDKKPMAKSVTAMVDGEEVEAIDATDLIKSLAARVDATDTTLAKALESTLGTIKAQGEMIKSLSAQVKKLGGEGRGRKAVLTVVEKPAAGDQVMAKSQPEGLSQQEFMAKANTAFAAGKITGKELTVADVSIRMGQPIPQEIMAKALA